MDEELSMFFTIKNIINKDLIDLVINRIKEIIIILSKNIKLRLNFSSLIIIYDFQQIVNEELKVFDVKVKLIDFGLFDINSDNIDQGPDKNSIMPLNNLINLLTNIKR